jgi:lipase chaperone LimK
LIASISAFRRFADFRSTDTTKGVFDMAIQAQPFTNETADQSVGPAAARLRWLVQRAASWANTYADYYAAAALYEQLRGLSDAELQRRGLSRETLARDACARCDRIVDH